MEITQSGRQRAKWGKKKVKARVPWGNIKCASLLIIGTLVGEERK